MADYCIIQSGQIVGFQSEPFPIPTPQHTECGTLLPLIRDVSDYDSDTHVLDGVDHEITDTYVREVVRLRGLSPAEKKAKLAERRAAQYPEIGDQLDAILKGLETVNKHIPLPLETVELIAEWRAIKRNNRLT